jgi:transcriptional regulator with GAF, ATPase, and Fis domain
MSFRAPEQAPSEHPGDHHRTSSWLDGSAPSSRRPADTTIDRPVLDRLVQAARDLEAERDPQATMDAAVRLAATNIPGCDSATLTLVTGRTRTLETSAHTDPLARDGDLLQHELGEGPCLTAIWEERVVHSGDLARDPRWPVWGPRVWRDLGAASMLAFQLFTHGDTLGALNLYSRSRGAFDISDRDEGAALAAHIALAVSTARRLEQLDRALDSRTAIGQATGMLMERYRMDARQAFALLSRVSSHTNTKIRAVADTLVGTGRLPTVE